jgi:hypothetical protein
MAIGFAMGNDVPKPVKHQFNRARLVTLSQPVRPDDQALFIFKE